MALCIICETEKPDADFKVRRGKLSTECNDCTANLKARTKRENTLVQAIIDAPGQNLPAIRGSSEERLKLAVDKRMELYKEGALEALYALALMEITGANSATLQVKYLAACRLAGPQIETGVRADNPMADVLKDLNDRFNENAPKIRSIRERIVEFDQSAAALPSP